MFHLSKAEAVRKILNYQHHIISSYLGIFRNLRIVASQALQSSFVVPFELFCRNCIDSPEIGQLNNGITLEPAYQELFFPLDSDVLPQNFRLSGILQESVLTGK